MSVGAEVPPGQREAGSGELTALLRPVRQGNAFEETVERLLSIIKLGMVAPGERFPAERELAAQLGISRLTLREAISELHRGWLCLLPARPVRRHVRDLHAAGPGLRPNCGGSPPRTATS